MDEDRQFPVIGAIGQKQTKSPNRERHSLCSLSSDRHNPFTNFAIVVYEFVL